MHKCERKRNPRSYDSTERMHMSTSNLHRKISGENYRKEIMMKSLFNPANLRSTDIES